jgi:hypothetical protein
MDAIKYEEKLKSGSGIKVPKKISLISSKDENLYVESVKIFL